MNYKILFLLSLILLQNILSEVPKNIFIAGDSTADENGAHNGKTAGWGKYLAEYVTSKVHNHAYSGQSARTFYRDGAWNNLIKEVSKGDYVFIQCGGSKCKPKRSSWRDWR